MNSNQHSIVNFDTKYSNQEEKNMIFIEWQVFHVAFIKRQNKMRYFAFEMQPNIAKFCNFCDFIAKVCNIFNPSYIAHCECNVCLGDKMKSIATSCVLEI